MDFLAAAWVAIETLIFLRLVFVSYGHYGLAQDAFAQF